MPRVIVGMSGGVDSAVCAYLLKAAGYDVIGITLRTWMTSDGKDSRCCEIDDAQRVADEIGIPYYVRNCMSEFEERVTKPFVSDYIKGLTPNPCIPCNRYVKWAGMIKAADDMQAQFIATGHYASIVKLENGRYTVKKALHSDKDQAYMLYRLTQDQLARTLMPLGNLSKDEVRNIADKAGLSVASKADSQEICFVPDGDYAGYIENNAEGTVPGEGNFVDEEGHVLGRHKGIIHYTVGQRKGLGLAMGDPVFVKEIRADRDEVVISAEGALFTKEVLCRDVSFQSIEGLSEGESLKCSAKIRYRHAGEEAEIEGAKDGGIMIHFKDPVRAASPGQSAVFYDADGCVIGGGIIV
ncbi:MAG: tRNA 2-thiouridine(34) synthase MnmA [Lachnospiraceae bacterium]|nr:tRNA 2-thiouridine(34) synthase MnmA [Lachnospiraceae bacterium]